MLDLTQYQTEGTICIFQPWTPSFDPTSNQGMLIPTWITLNCMPWQFSLIASDIVSTLGKVLAWDPNPSIFIELRFCVALDTSLGWDTKIKV